VPKSRDGPREDTLVPVPTRFFVSSGKGINKTSELNAFDLALLQAGIGEQNLVSVSSVLPIGILRRGRTHPRHPEVAQGVPEVAHGGDRALPRR
jgi:hypothetical protein